jgi:hypothetical protein
MTRVCICGALCAPTAGRQFSRIEAYGVIEPRSR